MISQEIKLYEEPQKVVVTYQSQQQQGYNSYTRRWTQDEIDKAIILARNLGLVPGAKFTYNHTPEVIIEIVSFWDDPQKVYSIKGAPTIFRCIRHNNGIKQSEAPIPYSINEFLGDNMSIIKLIKE